mmetsp:Transcript_159563/g.507963  ORF Transcript_159563/g.507963 Transcript_159563/m.507963 type:complete len:125 (+) Transcript_159563:625-999(+)
MARGARHEPGPLCPRCRKQLRDRSVVCCRGLRWQQFVPRVSRGLGSLEWWVRTLATLNAHALRHYNAAAFGPDGYLYVAGAFRHTGYLRVVERYDARVDKWDNTWEKLPEMEVPILFCSGAFIF